MLHFTIVALLGISLFSIAHAEQLSIENNSQKSVEVGKQVQIEADLRNGQAIEQDFAYIVQIQNSNGITVSLSWLTGKLAPAQTLTPAISWIPDEIGTYDVTIFVWEGINNPTALSHTLSMKVTVSNSL
ncbi:MAG: hypothetical protein QXW91_04785 [Candidatus Nitrosotenuis sp.]